MTTLTAPRPVEPGAAPAAAAGTSVAAALGVGSWSWSESGSCIWSFTKGQDTLALAGPRTHGCARQAHRFPRRRPRRPRHQSPDPVHLLAGRGASSTPSNGCSAWSRSPNLPRPVPKSAGWASSRSRSGSGYVVAGWRIPVLVALSFGSFALFGYWEEAMDLLIVTFVAVVLCVIIGMPLGVRIGTSRKAIAVITPILDLMQTMPTFVYLLPVALFFGIGASGCGGLHPHLCASADHPDRRPRHRPCRPPRSRRPTRWARPSGSGCEGPAARWPARPSSSASTRRSWRRCRWRRSRAFVNGPGFGRAGARGVSSGWTSEAPSSPGLAIVVMAVMLDRTTTAASERGELVARGGG